MTSLRESILDLQRWNAAEMHCTRRGPLMDVMTAPVIRDSLRYSHPERSLVDALTQMVMNGKQKIFAILVVIDAVLAFDTFIEFDGFQQG